MLIFWLIFVFPLVLNVSYSKRHFSLTTFFKINPLIHCLIVRTCPGPFQRNQDDGGASWVYSAYTGFLPQSKLTIHVSMDGCLFVYLVSLCVTLLPQQMPRFYLPLCTLVHTWKPVHSFGNFRNLSRSSEIQKNIYLLFASSASEHTANN